MISFEAAESEDARNLIRLLDEELLRRYPALTAVHGLHPQDLADPEFTFAVARIDGRAVGCGALRSLQPGISEIKRMFVLPEFRGRGVARRILAALESRARDQGRDCVRLETGIGQPEAIGLYRSAGYREIAGFGEYAGNSYSLCFEKRFTVAPAEPLSQVSVREATVDDAKPVADILNSVIAEGRHRFSIGPFRRKRKSGPGLP